MREPTGDRARPTAMNSPFPTRLLMALVVAALGLAPALLLAGPAYACSCAQVPLAEQVAASDVVVIGAVDSMENRDRALEVTIDVDEVVRGDASTGTLLIRTASDGAACGLDFLQVGERYAFLAARGDGEALVAGLCGGTTALRPGLVEELEAAAAAAPPAAPVAETTQAAPEAEGGQDADRTTGSDEDRDEGQARRTPVLVALVALGTLLVAAGVVAWRRRRR